MHPRDRPFNGVNFAREDHQELPEWSRLFRGYESHEIHSSLLSPVSSMATAFAVLSLFYIARFILQLPESLSPHTSRPYPPLPSAWPAPFSGVSFRELSFVLSRPPLLSILIQHPPPRRRRPRITYLRLYALRAVVLYSLTLRPFPPVPTRVLKQLSSSPVSLST